MNDPPNLHPVTPTAAAWAAPAAQADGAAPLLAIELSTEDERWLVGLTREGAHQLFELLATSLGIPAELAGLRSEVQRLKWRLNHQTADDAEACRQGKHQDCGNDG